MDGIPPTSAPLFGSTNIPCSWSSYTLFGWDDALVAVLILVLSTVYLTQNKKDPNYHLWFVRPQASSPRSESASRTTNIGHVLQEKGQEIVVFYASQSGTSQRLAHHLGQAIDRQFSKSACVAELSDFDSDTIPLIPRGIPVIFILSTYGEGDPPDNGIPFFEWARTAGKRKNLLDGVQFAVLGVGSSNYKSYNQFARTSHEFLGNVGATPLLDLHLADDASGMLEEDYSRWKEQLLVSLVSKLGWVEQLRAYRPALQVRFTQDDTSAAPNLYKPVDVRTSKARNALSPIYRLPVHSSRFLTRPPARSVIHLDIDISEHLELKYNTGDHIALWAENEDAEVQLLCDRLGITTAEMNRRLEITRENPSSSWRHIAGPVTLRSLFKSRLEIAASLSRESIKDLQQFAPSAAAKTFLESVSSNVASYVQYQSSRKITLASVLRDASPVEPWQIPLSFIFEQVAPLRPRYYSICSTASVEPRRVSITVSLTTLRLSGSDEVVRGLASHYALDTLTTLQDEEPTQPETANVARAGPNGTMTRHAFWQIRKSQFRMPVTPSRPMIMVATGSGIAPFRAFTQHMVKQANLGKDIGQMMLFFGCRGPEEHLYKDELDSLASHLGGKLSIIPAYSRIGRGERHVQDAIREEGEVVSRLMTAEDATLHVCGSSSMARNVRVALCEVIRAYRGWSAEEFSEFETASRRSRRWQEDVWG